MVRATKIQGKCITYQLSYTLAGAVGIDISANIEIVKECIRGIDSAYSIADNLGLKIVHRPLCLCQRWIEG